jgi:UDP-N-acetylmuramoyl-tripeptide--D-alanyl-D-alanine ligase
LNPVNLATIADWAGGTLLQGHAGALVRNVCTDSRTLAAGDLFVALRGDNFDGNAFAAEAHKRGAACAILEKPPSDLPESFAVIQVEDALAALQSLAGRYRKTLAIKVLAITGSNGKTSTKDMAAAVLGECFRVIKTEGNLNNHIGLPLMLLRATSAHEIGVFEIGMNHPGEIAPLVKLAAPVAGIITNIGVAHIEFMGSREAIALEKGSLAEGLPPGGVLVLNSADSFSPEIAKRTQAKTVSAGINGADIRARDLRPSAEGTRFILENGTGCVEAFLPVPGVHMVENALLAIAAGRFFGVSLEGAAAGLKKATLTKGRLEVKRVRGIRILDDTYNANPDSVVAALKTLAAFPAARRIAVLGRMNELGLEFERGHRRVGEAAGREKVDSVLSVGEGAAFISESAREHGVPETAHAATVEEAAAILRGLAREGDSVLVKGSRSLRMERIVEAMARP